MKRSLVACLAIGICVLFGLGTLSGQGKSDSKVKMTVKASPVSGGKQTFDINLKIEDGWHIYANPVQHEFLTASQTTVKIAGVDAKQVKVDYPAGVEKVDEGDKYRVYVGDITIKATVDRGPADTTPLRIRVDVSSCGGKKCLPPATLEAKVD